MPLLSRITLLLALALMTLLVGCKKPQQDDGPPGTHPAAFVGAYRNELGSRGRGSFYLLQLLETRADGTATFSSQHSDPKDKNAGVEKVANGKWIAHGNTITVTLEFSAAGEPIPKNDSKLTLIAAEDGSLMSFEGGGGATLRRQSPATRPAP